MLSLEGAETPTAEEESEARSSNSRGKSGDNRVSAYYRERWSFYSVRSRGRARGHGGHVIATGRSRIAADLIQIGGDTILGLQARNFESGRPGESQVGPARPVVRGRRGLRAGR